MRLKFQKTLCLFKFRAAGCLHYARWQPALCSALCAVVFCIFFLGNLQSHRRHQMKPAMRFNSDTSRNLKYTRNVGFALCNIFVFPTVDWAPFSYAHFRVRRLWFPYSRCAGLMANNRSRLISFIAVSEGHGFRTIDQRAWYTGHEFRTRNYAHFRVGRT